MNGTQFRAALRFLNMSQEGCAKYLCITSTYVNQYANDLRVIPENIAKSLTDLCDSPDGAPDDLQRKRRTKEQIAADNIERIRELERRR